MSGQHFKSCATVNLHKLNFQTQDSFLVGTKFVGQTLTNNVLREFHDVMCCYLALNKFPQPSLLVWLVLLITVLYDQTCLLLLLVSCVLLWSHTCFHFCGMSPRVLSSPCSETQWLLSHLSVLSGPVPSAPSKSSGAGVLNLTSGARCLLITGSFWK